MYYYWVYGLILKSEIEFIELYPIAHTDTIDVELTIGSIKTYIDFFTIDPTTNSHISSREFYVQVPGLASFYSGFGNKIVIDPNSNASMDLVRLHCLSNAFIALLHQRGHIPIHASSIIYNQKLIMMLGDRGSGKSTLFAGLRHNGYIPFSDDVCVPILEQDNGEVRFFSSYPMIKMKYDTITLLDSEMKSDYFQLSGGIDKYGTYFHDDFQTGSFSPAMLIYLETVASDHQVSLSPVCGTEKFTRLDKNLYRNNYLFNSGLIEKHFSLLSNLAEQYDAYIIKRPDGVDTYKEVLGLLEELIHKNGSECKS